MTRQSKYINAYHDILVTWAYSLAWIEYEVADSPLLTQSVGGTGNDLVTRVQIPVGPFYLFTKKYKNTENFQKKLFYEDFLLRKSARKVY